MTDPKSEETIFAEALRLPPEERAAYLAQSTSGSAELRRRVESLLGSHEAGEFLEQAAAPQLRPTRLLTVPLTEKPGDTIGRYKLLQQIGEGGCGVVYMAEQAEPVRRRVALKVIKLGMDTKSVIARFEAERQAVALMDHANIAKVFDAGATEAGRPFFVMELVRGMKITDYCDEAKLSTRARLDLFIQVCQAIQHAHQKGIIHRDIKPSNILVTVNDGVPVPKVIDFGIAKATSGQQLTDKTLFTAFEQFIGTPAYMSPEQAMLTSLDIDTRSDIYALGVLLYEMLTGKTPFDAKELLAIGLDEMRRTIREKEPERPSTRVSTLASEDLSTTAQRRGLDADIQRHVNNEPVLACPPGTLYRFQKAVRRNKLAFVAGMSVAAALVIGLGVSTWMFVEQKAALKRAVAAELEQTRLRQVAEANGKKAGSEAAKSEQVAQFLKDMLAGVKPAVAAGRDTTILKEILEKTTERVGREFNNQPEVEAELSFTLGETYFWLGDQKRAEPLLQQALALQRKLFGDKSLAVITSLDVLSFVWSLQGKHEEGEAAAREALTSARQLLGNNHPIVGRELAALANVLRKSGRATEAEPYGREAVSVLRSALGNENYETTVALNKLAMILEHQGEFAEAEELMREAVATQRKLFGDGQFELANTLVILGRILAKQSKFAEAEVRIREGVAIGKKLLGDSHPDALGMLAILADVLVQEGKLGEVEALHREYLEIARQKFGNDHSAVAESLHNLGVAIMKQGRLAEAETALREALVTTRKLDGPEHPNTAVSLYVLGNVIGQQGRWAEAEPLTREALTLRKKLLGNEDPVVAETLWHLGLILTRQDKEAEAETALREALAIFQKNEDSGAIASTLGLLAGVLTAQGKVPEAKTLYREALDLSKKPGNEHVDRCPLHLDFGNFLRDQGEFTEAEANFRGALALALAAGRKRGSEHPNLGHSVSFLIKLLEQQGRLPGEALAIYKALPESAHRPRAEVIRLWTEVLLREERFDEADKLFTETLGLNAESRLERAAFLKVRGGFAGDRGQWQAAAADLAQAIELNPDDSEVCHWLAPVLVHLGKLDAYREHCRKSLERFKKTTDPLVAERIAKDCLILPSSGADLETVSEMAERAVNATNHWAFRWFQLVKGLVEHRQGRFSSAVEWTDKALTKAGEHTVRDVAAWMVQAMAFHQRNQPDKALAALTKGSELAETKLAKLEAGDLGKDWGDWIIARTLLREARALIEARPVTAKDASK